ncbi:DUF1624 domain-containing protein [Mucilaginibacter limnophilus]|uniref:DUF1624 domain-containing protein n=1 Tax=Mucilaginibacter limnophilus TaxID=1932778 RepID=A0A3S2UJT1_9SPHI|nr:heparan-alpha-glucosaminide N-acetyltransferase domain-containing protein [Mucilaginibacter limnophilus]RVT99800.1 DUF1624 domain-containing protein [Mucilaginibacter limnophilus]
MTSTLTATPKKRIESIDILRGIIMVIMALDHTRDFFMPQEGPHAVNPTDLSRASDALFLTRFITHFCAPIFVFLAGVSVMFVLSRRTKAQASGFLISRGLWLILLEVTVIGFAWNVRIDPHFVFVQVIWAIGVSMIVLAGLIWLPKPVIALFGLILIFGHNAFDKVKTTDFSEGGAILWQFLHVQGLADFHNGYRVFVLYPLIPWISVMAVGYVFGSIFKMDAAKRKRLLLTIGTSSLILFVILRSGNFYGDLLPWKEQGSLERNLLSFINVTKYPPSLDYLLITLGVANLALAGLENVKSRFTDWMLVYGRVPLFYYILHFYLLLFFAGIAYFGIKIITRDVGVPLYGVYLIWLTIVFILYFPCRWYMKYKMTHKQWWLSYL